MNWRYVDVWQVYLIHQLVIRRAGTRAGVRDFTLLHSAVERPRASFQGKDLYITVFDKAAALLQSLCLNHPFTDGNKRTAWAATHKFLWDNGVYLKANMAEVVKFMVWVDNKQPELRKISFWLKKYSKKI